jgi:hypothetical protein
MLDPLLVGEITERFAACGRFVGAFLPVFPESKEDMLTSAFRLVVLRLNSIRN